MPGELRDEGWQRVRVLGLNAYAHDAGVAVVESGVPVFALEEERINRERKTTAFPRGGISWLRKSRGLELADFDAVAFPWDRTAMLRTLAKLVLGQFPPAYRLMTRAASPTMNFRTVLEFFRAESDLTGAFESAERARIRFVNHHLAHACNAYFSSPFESAAVLVMDGFGDDGSTSLHRARGSSVQRLAGNRLLDSIGILYSMVTRYLGFETILDEGTVMALAAGGRGEFVQAFRALVRLEAGGRYSIDRRHFCYPRFGEIRPMAPIFERRFGPGRQPAEEITERHREIAHALQKTVEETIVHVARGLREQTGEPNLCLGGGVAMNCVSAARVAAESGFERVFVSPSPSDSGQALGAALALANATGGGSGLPRREEISPYLGPEFRCCEIVAALRKAGVSYGEESDPAVFAAGELARGRLVGWFQGAMETGPRALGNRSILGDPRHPGLRERLNREIKRRQPFRPFAPSVLSEHAREYFEPSPPSPYMSFAVRVKRERRGQIPAVVADDGTARLHTVTERANPLYHRLIRDFARRTDVPMVLNTSFNVQEPVVCTPRDAVATFLRSGLDTLVIGRFSVRRPG